jgi:biopolymer transport protein ExbD
MKLTSRKSQRGSKIELAMASMIDVVFLLLIFFMTTASFVKTERELDSAIKVKKKSVQQTPRDLQPAIVDIVRGDMGFVYRIGSRDMATAEELTDVLRQFDNKADGAFVRVSDEAPFQMAAAAIQACKSANFLTVSYVPLNTTD